MSSMQVEKYHKQRRDIGYLNITTIENILSRLELSFNFQIVNRKRVLCFHFNTFLSADGLRIQVHNFLSDSIL